MSGKGGGLFVGQGHPLLRVGKNDDFRGRQKGSTVLFVTGGFSESRPNTFASVGMEHRENGMIVSTIRYKKADV